MKLKGRVLEVRHWPATSGDIALAVPCSKSSVRYYALIGVARPPTDSRGRGLYLPEHLDAIRKKYREHRSKKK